MKTRFIIDVATGVVTRTIGGVEVPASVASILTAGDRLPCEVVFKLGAADVTEQVLPEGSTLRLGIRLNAGRGDILAQSDEHEMVEGVANCVLDLGTRSVAALVDPACAPAYLREFPVSFEVEVEEADGSLITYAQRPFKLRFEVNMKGDEPPAKAEQSALNASQHAASALESKNAAEGFKTAAEAAAETAAVNAETATEKADAASQSAAAAVAAKEAAELERNTAGQHRNDAEFFKNHAGQSAINAHEAQLAAEQARDHAQQHQNDALQLKLDAEAARDKAQEWAEKTDGEVAPGQFSAKKHAQDAEQHKNAAAQSETNAANSAGIAATQASVATTKANEASASATAALNAILGLYQGGVAGNSVPATATPGAGAWYDILSDGTSQGTVWLTGDIARYNGVSGSWTRIPAGVVTEARVLRGDISRALAPLHYSNGATGGRCIRLQPGAAGNVAGLPTTFWARRFRIPATGDYHYFWVLANVATFTASNIGPVVHGLALSLNGTTLVLSQRGAGVSDARELRYSDFRNVYAGQDVDIIVVFPEGDSETDPKIYINGIDATANFSLTTNGTPPKWMPTTLNCTYFLQGFELPAGTFGGVEYGPGVWSEAEIVRAAITGQAPDWWRLGTGSAANLVANSDFSSFTGTIDDGNEDSFSSWTTVANLKAEAITGGIRISAKEGWVSNNGGANVMPQAAIGNPVLGRRYLLVVRGRKLGNATGIQVTWPSGVFRGAIALTDEVTTVTRSFTVTSLSGSATLGIRPESGTFEGGSGIELEYIRVYQLGSVSDLEPDPNRTLRDRKANGLHGVRTSGVYYLGDKIDSEIVARVSHAGSGPLQFGGQSLIDTTKGWVIESLIVRSTAAVTWSLGSASGGAQYVSAYSLAVGDNYIPSDSLVTRVINGASLWSQSNGAADITIYLRLRRTF